MVSDLATGHELHTLHPTPYTLISAPLLAGPHWYVPVRLFTDPAEVSLDLRLGAELLQRVQLVAQGAVGEQRVDLPVARGAEQCDFSPAMLARRQVVAGEP